MLAIASWADAVGKPAMACRRRHFVGSSDATCRDLEKKCLEGAQQTMAIEASLKRLWGQVGSRFSVQSGQLNTRKPRDLSMSAHDVGKIAFYGVGFQRTARGSFIRNLVVSDAVA